jgi:glyoxylase-like metal-dependent hydrolase (beta-lactamase superfamily II)
MSPACKISRVLGTLLLVAATRCMAQSRCDAPRNPVFAKYEKLDITDGWFEVYRLPGGVYALFEPRQAEQVFSYLIVGEKRALLFDSGFGIGHIDAVIKRLTPLPVLVLNSHTHYDHVGGNFAFSEILGVDSDYTRKSAQGKRTR